MGVVYEGLDEALQRRVALKVIHSKYRLDTAAKTRFLREARILSQLDHPRICRVYDFIEGKEHDFLVLELVEGISFRQALKDPIDERRKMDIAEQLLDVLAAVHRAGVIHRDLKPENVMLTPDGDIKVLDFGLARSEINEASLPGSTVVLEKKPGVGWHSTPAISKETDACRDTAALESQMDTTPAKSGFSQSGTAKTTEGMVIGTVGYMSPEQARGEPATAASDMYSLGLILQELFSGNRAFDAGLPRTALLFKTAQGDTLPVENVHGGLKTLIERLKSLEPAARPTAMDATERFQWIREAPRRRRRRRLIAAAWLIVTIFAAVSTFQAVRLSTARKRERLANRFGTEVQRIDSLMRFAHLAPLHDLEEDRERVRGRVAWIQRHLGDVGSWGVGPGLFAIGRGNLALGEYEEAERSLKKSWEKGYREPEVAYALGRTLGALYQQGLDQLRFISDTRGRADERKRIEKEMRDPAIEFLKACAGGETVQSNYVEGLLALYEGRFDDALASAQHCERSATWQYEGRFLEGRARFLKARKEAESGKHRDAEKSFRASEKAFSEAVEVGRSDPRGWTGLCDVWTSVMEMHLYGAGGDLQGAFKKAISACDASLVADSRQPIVLNDKWACFRMLAESRMNGDPEGASEALDGARKIAGQLVRMRPDSSLAHHSLGLTLILSSILKTRTGKDGRIDGTAGVSDLEKATELDPNSSGTALDLGNGYQNLGSAVKARSGDPLPYYLKAEKAFERAIELRPDFVFAFNNLAALELILADLKQERGDDPTSHCDEAVRNGHKALELKPDHVYALANIAGALNIKGRYLAEKGKGDPEAIFAEAIAAAERALELNNDFLPGYLYIAESSLELARYRATQKKTVRDVVNRGLKAVQEALKRAPCFPDALKLQGDLEELRRNPR